MKHPFAVAMLGSALVAVAVIRGTGDKQFATVPVYAPEPTGRAERVDSAGIELLKLGNRLQAQKQYADAIAAYDRAASGLPQIADWISAFAATSASYQGDTAEVARRLSSVDDTLFSEWAWRTRVRAFATARDLRRALQIATQATKTGTLNKRADAWYRVAELQRDLGNPDAQRAALREAIAIAPQSSGAMNAALELIDRKDVSANERFRLASVLTRTGQVARGIREMERALASGDLTDKSQAHYELGRLHFAAGRHADAIKHLSSVARGTEHRVEARFMMARSQYRSGKDAAARQTLQDVADVYPKSAAATRALFFLADLAQDENRLTEARRLFEAAASAPAKTNESALALMRLGAIAYAQGDYSRAASTFQKFRSRYGPGNANNQATYWLAQTRLRQGDRAGATELLRSVRNSAPLSYYGMRSAELLGSSLQTATAAGPSTSSDVATSVNAKLDRWSLLRDVGWTDAASFELSRLRKGLSGDHAALYTYAEEMQRRGAPHVSIETGRALLNDGSGWNQRLLKIMYPMPYQDLIEREARARGLDPYFVAALIRQESRFNRNAQSPVGAVGLMQVMPATQKMLSKSTGEFGSLTDAETNIKLGTKFLADLVATYGRSDLVLAAYNAGPGRANRWRNFPEVAAEDLFVERIPFEETRDYVKVVELNAAIYRAIYAAPSTRR